MEIYGTLSSNPYPKKIGLSIFPNAAIHPAKQGVLANSKGAFVEGRHHQNSTRSQLQRLPVRPVDRQQAAHAHGKVCERTNCGDDHLLQSAIFHATWKWSRQHPAAPKSRQL